MRSLLLDSPQAWRPCGVGRASLGSECLASQKLADRSLKHLCVCIERFEIWFWNVVLLLDARRQDSSSEALQGKKELAY